MSDNDNQYQRTRLTRKELKNLMKNPARAKDDAERPKVIRSPGDEEMKQEQAAEISRARYFDKLHGVRHPVNQKPQMSYEAAMKLKAEMKLARPVLTDRGWVC